jgi:hypothetical protein
LLCSRSLAQRSLPGLRMSLPAGTRAEAQPYSIVR